jgi:uncharacterized protein (TIGR03437 family)
MNVEMWSNSMNQHKIWMFGAALCLVGLGFSDTASGQITATPAGGMNFQVQSGGATATQQLSLTTSNPTTLMVTVPANQSWLTVNGAPANSQLFPNTPASLNVTVNTTGFNSGAVVSTTIAIVESGQPTTAINYTVTLTVGTPSLLTANPANLTFSAVQGASSGNPGSIPVTISSSGSPLNYNVTATTSAGGNWILLTNTSGTTGGTGFQVQVNPSGLAANNYSGFVNVQSQTTGDSVTISVSLTVTVGAALNVTGTPLTSFFYQYQSGQANFSAEQQTLMISTTSGSLNYSVTPSTTGSTASNTTNWLVLSQTGGTATSTPQPLNLSLSYQYVAALPPGTYGLNLAIAPTGPSNSANTVNVAVTLVVTTNPLLVVSARTLAFTVPLGTTSSAAQTIQISSSSGASIPYQAQPSASWLTVFPQSGTTSSNPTISVSINAAGLSVSNTPYTGTITVSPTNSDAGLYNIQIAVSVTVTGATSTIYAGPGALLFSYETAVTPTPLAVQLVQLTSNSTVGFSVTTTTMGANNCPTSNWLNATQNQSVTPATLSVSVATTGMTAGFCTGTVIVTYNNGTNANTSVNIPVTVDISSTALLTVSPPFGFGVVTATAQSNAAISSQISINSTDGSALRFTANASTPNSPVTWLFLGSSSGTTQQYLQVQISPGGLAVGTYTGSITISPQGDSSTLPSGTLTIPVVLTVSANTTVTVSPTSLSFSQSQGATTAPASQTVSLTATGGSTTFTASVSPVTGGTWLQVSPLSGTASSTAGTFTASVLQNSLSPGTYTSNIVLTFQNAATPTVTIPVSLVVTTAQTVAATPTSLSYAFQLGGAAPPTQTIKVTSTGGAATITAAPASTTGWLSVTPTSGSTGADGSPLTLTVTVTPSTLTAAGTYTGAVTITPAGQTPIMVPVTVTVTGVPMPQPSTISNSGSGGFGSIAPGELITIKGTNLGPASASSFSVGPGGTVSSTLAGVQVMFDGIPGTPTYVSAAQINVIVPYEIAGRATTTVTVVYQSQTSAGISQQVANQAPGIYTFSATGAGQASVLNQNYSYNGPPTGIVVGGQTVTTVPAAQGSVISVFMTGGGQSNPASVTGTVTPNAGILYKIPGTVTATINGVNAIVEFAGEAPGLVTGVIQVNVLVPTGVTGNGLPLSITINGTTTLTGPTIAVQ